MNSKDAAIVFTCSVMLVASLRPAQGQSSLGVLEEYREQVEAATEKGLQYLVCEQREDGSYSGVSGETTGVVALGGMAFLAKGYTPGAGRYGDAIDKCIDYVLKHQDASGYFGKVGGGKMYSHTIVTLFLSESSGMVDIERQKKLDVAIPRAVEIILKAQQVQKQEQHQGGWRYNPNSPDSDLSCSGWALMALRSARLNGAPVPDKAIADAVTYILRNRDKLHGGFGYNGPSSTITLSGAGLLCLELTGHHGEPITFAAGDYILNTKDALPREKNAVYGLYYNAQAMFQLGGKYWSKFGTWMYDVWLPRQQANGAWEHEGKGCPYGTAMCLLSLTVPYRQLPIYQRDETVDDEGE